MSENIRPKFHDHVELVRTVADPHNHKPIRLPTYPDVEKTSTLPFVATKQAVVQASGTSLALLTRSPTAPLWISQSGTTQSDCWINFAFGAGGSMGVVPQGAGQNYDIKGQLIGRPIRTMTNWPFWDGIGIDKDDEYWIWVPNGFLFATRLHTNATMSGGTWIMELETTQNFLTVDTYRYTLNTGWFGSGSTYYFCNSPITSGGMFVRPTVLTCTVNSSASVGITNISLLVFTGGDPAVPTGALSYNCLAPAFNSPPEFSNAPSIYGSCRLNAASALFQNTTAVLNKEGSVECMLVGMQQTGAQLVHSLFDYSALAADVAASCRYSGLLEKGLYTFSVPDRSTTRFYDCVQTSLNGAKIPILNLDSFDYVNVVRFTDYSAPSTNLFITLDVHHEFRNTTMLWPIGVSGVELEPWHKAMVTIQTMSVFYENPIHISMIGNIARAAALRMYPVIRPVAMAALGAAKDKLMNMAASALSSKMHPQIQLSSAPPKRKSPKPKAKKVSVKVKGRR